MTAITTMHPAIGRCRILAGIALVWFLAISVRLVDLQVIRADYLAEKAIRQQVGTVEFSAMRGVIYDRHGSELALSTPAQSIGVFSDRVEDKSGLARRLAKVLGVSEARLLRQLKRGGFQWVKRFVTLEEEEQIRALKLDVLHFETESRRFYPHGTVAAHVLGTVGVDHHGQAGLEQSFEDRLKGTPGVGIVQFDARQRRYGKQTLKSSIPGDSLILNLDLKIQKLAHLALERAIRETKSQAGTILLMRPDSGEIVAMANWPRFDPNNLSRTPEELENYRNFAISHLVEPGSTFKVVTAAAALEEGLATPEDVFDCEMGGIWVRGRRIRDHHPYGLLTLPGVLIKSSNVGIIKVGLRVGEETMHSYIRRYGFGQPTGLILPGEVHGVVRRPSSWTPGSLPSISMGQEIGVSAVQMARLFAAIANGGMLVQPRVVRTLREQDGTEVEIDPGVSRRVMNAETAATMRAILERVVEEGTGRRARIPGYRVAGKTGTAQMINPETRTYAQGSYLASFCGLAPVNDPKLVGVAMLYDPRGQHYYGGLIAAPLFATVVKQALRHMDVPPSRTPPSTNRRPVPAQTLLSDFVENPRDAFHTAAFPVDAHRSDEYEMVTSPDPIPVVREPAAVPTEATAGETNTGYTAPDMRGLTMRAALVLAARLGIEVESVGSGFVRHQFPEPNAPLAERQVLRLHFTLSPPSADTSSDSSGRTGG